jgi:hypothetical protein
LDWGIFLSLLPVVGVKHIGLSWIHPPPHPLLLLSDAPLENARAAQAIPLPLQGDLEGSVLEGHAKHGACNLACKYAP